MARILLGVSGGIAAYKTLELVRLAMAAGHSVRVVMTPTATRFVGTASFEGITGAPVLIDEFSPDPMRGAFPGDPLPAHAPIGHLEVAANTDAFLVAPASANTIAKLAGGFADGMLTTVFLACSAPRAVAPAMNDRMYSDPATGSNLETLRAHGVRVIEPEEGALASRGEYGLGRLASPERLLAELESMLPSTAGSLDGLRILVTAGGTREAIDSVRYVGNRSSGRMGLALATRAARRGAEVTLVAANVSLPRPAGVRWVAVESAAELAVATKAEFADSHVLLMAAAVADFTPAGPSGEKIVKTGRDGLDLHLEPTEDVLAALAGVRAPGQTLIGFAAEHGEGGVERARCKLRRKRVDAVVVNDISRPEIGFESERNEVVIVEADGETEVPLASKEEIADAILDRVSAIRSLARETL